MFPLWTYLYSIFVFRTCFTFRLWTLKDSSDLCDLSRGFTSRPSHPPPPPTWGLRSLFPSRFYLNPSPLRFLMLPFLWDFISQPLLLRLWNQRPLSCEELLIWDSESTLYIKLLSQFATVVLLYIYASLIWTGAARKKNNIFRSVCTKCKKQIHVLAEKPLPNLTL